MPSRAPRSASSDSVGPFGSSGGAPSVTPSAASGPASTAKSSAASATVRVIGPAVSWLCEIGITPSRLTRPIVGFRPTSPLIDAGETIEPSVSVPTPSGARLAAIAAAVPELDPLVLRSSAYGLRVRPPRPLQPLVERVERMLAHSLRLVLPRTIAPASRSRRTRCASRFAWTPASASEPPVVHMRSPVAMLSFSSTGIPCSGPRRWPARRSASQTFASPSASGLSSMTLFSRGPRRSTAAMRARHCATSRSAVTRPSAIARDRSVARASSSSRRPAAGRADGAAMASPPEESSAAVESSTSRRRMVTIVVGRAAQPFGPDARSCGASKIQVADGGPRPGDG